MGREMNSLKHGIYTAERQKELRELKDRLQTEPGRLEYRAELASFLAWIVQDGAVELQRKREAGETIWQDGPLHQLATYINSLTRLLDAWPKEKPSLDVTSIEVREGQDGEVHSGQDNVTN